LQNSGGLVPPVSPVLYTPDAPVFDHLPARCGCPGVSLRDAVTHDVHVPKSNLHRVSYCTDCDDRSRVALHCIIAKCSLDILQRSGERVVWCGLPGYKKYLKFETNMR